MSEHPLETRASEAAAAFDFAGARLERIPEGLINATYAVYPGGAEEPAAVLQRLNPIFSPAIHDDIDALTRHVAAKGLETPRLIPTAGGSLWVRIQGEVWRALTYVRGYAPGRLERPAQARSAGALAGRFHAATADFERPLAAARPGVHDTPAHLARLREAIAASAAEDEGAAAAERAEARELGSEILAHAARLPPLPELPERVAHGDLKISNIVFWREEPDRARCLIDLDTITRQTIAHELGDALRSWCNAGGEDAADAALDLGRLAAALEGYASGAGDLLSTREIEALIPGLETICVELASRFCADAFAETYFGWDPARYPSRRAHNIARARAQLRLAGSVADKRAPAHEAARAAFARAR